MRYFLLLCIYGVVSLQASALQKTQIESLANDKTWLRLLHYNKETKQSNIRNKDFFLSQDGRYNPSSELIATIHAYNKPFKDSHHARCKFPARYLWLSTHINLQNYVPIDKRCKKLDSWEVMDDIASLSVVFVSGFLGNPASVFGHSFLKVNKNNHEENTLLDNTISYGAKLPKEYTMLSYIYKGLTGGYNGVYSDKYYYMDDMVYANQDFREMWAYKLTLSERKRDLLLFHLWELQKIEFTYYFLNRNCGYKVSEILELVYDENIIDTAMVWYAPVETFYALERLNQKSTSIVDTIQYIPSKQQIIYASYEGLSTREKDIVNLLVNNGVEKFPWEYFQSTDASKTKILDFLLDFYVYKKTNNTSTDIAKIQRKILLERLNLPIIRYTKKKPDEKASITKGNKPRFLGIGIDRYDGKHIVELHYVPFAIEAVGYNNFQGDILSILDTTVAFHQNKLYLKKLDLVKIRRLKVQQLPFDIDNPFSWSLHIGTLKENDKRDYFVDIGGGYSWKLYDNMKLYSMLNASIHSIEQRYRLYPNIGLYGNFDKLRFNIEYGYENRELATTYDEKYFMNLQYNVSQSTSIYMDLKKYRYQHINVGLKWYF